MAVTYCSWADIRQTISKINPEFFEVLDECKVLKKYTLAIYEYNYGETIADNNYFYPPSDSELSPVAKVPFSMILKNKMESFVNFPNKSFPFAIMGPGNLLQITAFSRPDTRYSPDDMLTFSAGARSIFFLPEISDTKYHNNLCAEYTLNNLPPKNLADQHAIFKEIINKTKNPWKFKLLVFPKEWTAYALDSKNNAISAYIREHSLRRSAYKRNTVFYNFILSYIKNEFSLSGSNFCDDVVRQLFSITSGEMPGFGVIKDTSCIPHTIIEKAYSEVYGLKHAPILIAPKYLNPFKPKEPVYYSLKRPGFLYYTPNTGSVLKLCLNIKNLFNQYCKHIPQTNLAKNTIFHEVATKAKIQVISDYSGHSGSNKGNFLYLQRDMAQYDLNIERNLRRMNLSEESIPRRSAFLKGCFGLTYDQDIDC